MHHAFTRPAPLAWGAAGGICAVGAIAAIARGLDSFTAFSLAPPFHAIAFALCVICVPGGPIAIAYLMMQTRAERVRLLEAEVQRLRDRLTTQDQILEAVRSADAQAEVNTVLLRKLIKAAEERRIIDADTQPIARLHSIMGGGGA